MVSGFFYFNFKNYSIDKLNPSLQTSNNLINQMRLDEKLVQLKHAPTKSQALDLIKRSLVLVNGKIATKGGKITNPRTEIQVLESTHYVSRGAHKLLQALSHWQISLQDKVGADFGASTGGFTQVMLEAGAKQVFAIDVGADQLHRSLVNHPKVVNMPEQNVRNLKELSPKPEFACVDLSFISLKIVIPVILELCEPKAQLVLLYKPQFEVGPENLNKQGLVKPEIANIYLQEFLLYLKDLGLKKVEHIESTTKGKLGNQEFLIFLDNLS